MNKKLILVTVLIGLLMNCSLAPRYEKPAMPVPAAWPEGPAYEQSQKVAGATDALNLSWQNFFTDEYLNQIIALALDNNRDLRSAALNVQRAREMYGIQRSELFPTVNASAGMTKGRASTSSLGMDGGVNVEQYNVDLGMVSWEIDFFGRLRNLEQRALEEYLSTEEARRSVQISLVFEVANTYLAMAADRENLQLAQTTYETQKRMYDLIEKRFRVGISNELDLQRAQTQVDTALVDISRYTRMTAQDENALQLLIGSSTSNLAKWLPANLSHVEPPQDLTPGLPSDVLLQRPDILAAEHRLIGAYANIGAARAAMFPRISLTSALGTASGDLGDLFSSGTETWSYAPQVVLPIFDNRLRHAYKASQVEKDMMVAEYEKAIQTAFREVADALAVQGTVDKQIAAQQSLVNATDRSYELSNLRYTKGKDSYLGVLDAQRSLYAAQQQLVTLRLAKLANQARLYAVLGGGA